MPGNLMMMDAGFPHLSEDEDAREGLRKVQNYLFMLLEQLRYTLQNLTLADNFNENELNGFIDKIKANVIIANTIISNTIITNELYAQYGSIADLTVDKLRTDYKRAQKYLDGDTSPIDYISIHDEQIDFISATTDGRETEQLTVGGRKFFWTNDKRTQMTSEKDTGLPVTVYRYRELKKTAFAFNPLPLEDGGMSTMPVLTFGAGTGTGDNGKATLTKRENQMDFEYRTQTGEICGVYLRDDGFADVTQRRADILVNTGSRTITVTPEGQNQTDIVIDYEESGNTLHLTWPDGKSFRVVKA